ncbi:MAG: VOC family protein [Jatrophihabitantaceae bacterium]
MATHFQVTVDCGQPAPLVRFWCEALGYVPEPAPAGFDSWHDYLLSIGEPADQLAAELAQLPAGGDLCDSIVDPAGRGPRIWFQLVPEAKQLKNRLHLDLKVGGGRQAPIEERRRRIQAEADRLVTAGARQLTELGPDGSDHVAIVMQDPEGNEFCLH